MTEEASGPPTSPKTKTTSARTPRPGGWPELIGPFAVPTTLSQFSFAVPRGNSTSCAPHAFNMFTGFPSPGSSRSLETPTLRRPRTFDEKEQMHRYPRKSLERHWAAVERNRNFPKSRHYRPCTGDFFVSTHVLRSQFQYLRRYADNDVADDPYKPAIPNASANREIKNDSLKYSSISQDSQRTHFSAQSVTA